MIKTSLMLFLVLLTGSVVTNQVSAAPSQSAASLQQANVAFNAQKYTLAVQLYSKLIEENGYSANALFNLANSYAQMGDTGRAVVNYHRAHRLAPGDPDIQRNLELVTRHAGLFEEEQPMMEKIVNTFTFNQWCTGILLGLLLLSALSATSFFYGKHRNSITTAKTVLTIVLLLCMTVAYRSYQAYDDGVVITNSQLKISPFDQAASNGSIQQGRLVKILKEHQQFYLVEKKQKQTGWLPKSVVEHITPGQPSL